MTEPRPATDTARERIDRYLERRLEGRGPARVVPLTGDASDRRYFRILPAQGDPFVVALHAGPIEFATLPFANVAALLRQMPVPIPAIVGHDDALGIVAQSDLGDVTLQAHLGVATAAEHGALYRQAVEIIEVLQRRGTELASRDYLPYQLAFDVEKLTWEMHFFVKHFLEAYRGATIGVAERQALDEEWARLVGELAAEPRVLCHRDYHSRNLMYRAGQLHVIDFQDARLGPDTYDLVSLLRDSYVDLTDHDVDAFVAHFVTRRYGATAALPEFTRRFDLMSVQRNIKALGTFGYQATTRDNPVYIQYIPRTLQYVKRNLVRYPRFERLRELLATHVEEFR